MKRLHKISSQMLAKMFIEVKVLGLIFIEITRCRSDDVFSPLSPL